MSSIWTTRRSTSDIKVAGLCGGIARRWGVDPLLVRVGFVLLALSSGVGLILYAAGWLLLPADGRDSAPIDDLFGTSTRMWPREVWIALVSVSCIAAFALFGSLSPFGIGPALVIAIIWYFGVYRTRMAQRGDNRDGPPPSSAIQAPAPPAPFQYPGPPTPFTEAAEAWQRRIAEYRSAVAAADADQQERATFLATPDPVGLYAEPVQAYRTGSTARPRRRVSARRLGWATLLMLGLTLTGLGLADYLGATIPPIVYAAAALLVVGLALVLGTWLGRARGLLPVGVVLSLAILGLAAAGPLPGLPSSVPATRVVAYAAAAELPAGGDRLDAGKLTVDLSRLPIRTDTTYSARVDLGSIDVLVPPDTQVVARYALDAGTVTAFGRPPVSGSELSGVINDPQPLRPDRPTLTLDLGVDLGTVQVRR